jgi:hypothetical protein
MSDEEIEQLLRQTMSDFWKQNNLEQKYEIVRRALRKAAGLGYQEKVHTL